MKTAMRFAVLAAAAASFAGGSALAQTTGRVPLTNINFDLWCQEQQHLPPERCDKRLPQDDAAYQAYVAKIQSYEVPYLQEKQEKANMNQVIFHNDPIDGATRPGDPKPGPPDTPPSD